MVEAVKNYNVTISNTEKNIKWSKRVDEKTFKEFEAASHKGREYKHFLFGLFIPVRTDSIDNLIEDLILPTVVHVAMKIESEGIKKTFVLFGTFLMDMAAFKIRLVCLGIRWIMNAGSKDRFNTPMYALLLKHQAPDEIKNADQLRINFTQWESNKEFAEAEPAPLDITTKGSAKVFSIRISERSFLFKDLPESLCSPENRKTFNHNSSTSQPQPV